MEPEEILKEDVEVPHGFNNVKQNWEEKYRTKAANIFEGFDEEWTYIESLVGKNREVLPDQSIDSVLIYVIYNFARRNDKVIREFAEKKGYVYGPEQDFMILLKKMDSGYTDIVYHVFLFSLWLNNDNRRRYGIAEGELPEEFPSQITDAHLGFKQKLGQNTGDNYDFGEEMEIGFLQSNLFCIDRQTTDKEKRDMFAGRQRRRNKKTDFFEITNDNQIEFRVGPKAVRENLIEKIEDLFDLRLKPIDVIETDIDGYQFKQALINADEDDDWKITNIDIKKISAQPSVSLNLAKKSARKDIRPILSRWDERLLDVSILNIRRFWFRWNEIEGRVSIDERGENSLILDSKIKEISVRAEDTVREEFNDKFGVPLDKEIMEHRLTGELEKLIRVLLSNPPYYDIQGVNQQIIKEIEDLGILKVHQFDADEEEDEDEIYPGGIKKLELLRAGVREHIKSVLEATNINYVGMRNEDIFTKTHRFARITYKGETVDLSLPKYNSFTDKGYSYLRNSLKPILIVNIGSIDDRIIESRLSSRISLPELVKRDLHGESPEDYLQEKVQEIITSSESRVAEEARESYQKLKRVIQDDFEVGGTEFEGELFPIFKQLIPSSQRWGAKRGRGHQPDGLGELSFRYGNGKAHRAIAYDSKFVNSGEIEFDSDEGRQMQTYSHRIRKSDEITKSDSIFRNFIIITNAEDSGNFDNAAGYINRMRDWSGIPVLMHVEFLLGLYTVYNENSDFIKSHREDFHRSLYKKINGDKLGPHNEVNEDFYVELDEQSALEVLEDMEENVEDSNLDISSLREFMESGEFPG